MVIERLRFFHVRSWCAGWIELHVEQEKVELRHNTRRALQPPAARQIDSTSSRPPVSIPCLHQCQGEWRNCRAAGRNSRSLYGFPLDPDHFTFSTSLGFQL